MLIDNSHSPIDELLHDEIANDFTDSPEEIIDTLEVMGFITIKNTELVKITESGREFIE